MSQGVVVITYVLLAGFNVSGEHCFLFQPAASAQGQRETMDRVSIRDIPFSPSCRYRQLVAVSSRAKNFPTESSRTRFRWPEEYRATRHDTTRRNATRYELEISGGVTCQLHLGGRNRRELVLLMHRGRNNRQRKLTRKMKRCIQDEPVLNTLWAGTTGATCLVHWLASTSVLSVRIWSSFSRYCAPGNPTIIPT